MANLLILNIFDFYGKVIISNSLVIHAGLTCAKSFKLLPKAFQSFYSFHDS